MILIDLQKHLEAAGCPVCESKTVKYWESSSDWNSGTVQCKCETCKSEWTTEYYLEILEPEITKQTREMTVSEERELRTVQVEKLRLWNEAVDADNANPQVIE